MLLELHDVYDNCNNNRFVASIVLLRSGLFLYHNALVNERLQCISVLCPLCTSSQQFA